MTAPLGVLTILSMARIAVMATLLVACSSAAPADFEVPITSPGGDAYILLIYDDTGLVRGGRSTQWRNDVPVDDVVAFPDRQEIEIGWTGGACHHRPSFEILGDVSRLRIDVFKPIDPQLPFLPISCPAVGVPLRVTLILNEPVDAGAVDLHVAY